MRSCLREMPRLNGLAAEGQITVVAINYDPTTPAELNKLAAQYHIKVPLLIANEDAGSPSSPKRPAHQLSAR